MTTRSSGLLTIGNTGLGANRANQAERGCNVERVDVLVTPEGRETHSTPLVVGPVVADRLAARAEARNVCTNRDGEFRAIGGQMRRELNVTDLPGFLR